MIHLYEIPGQAKLAWGRGVGMKESTVERFRGIAKLREMGYNLNLDRDMGYMMSALVKIHLTEVYI